MKNWNFNSYPEYAGLRKGPLSSRHLAYRYLGTIEEARSFASETIGVFFEDHLKKNFKTAALLFVERLRVADDTTREPKKYMQIKIDHLAVWTQDLERLRSFYMTYFGAQCNDKYYNPTKRLETYFLTFEGGTRLEIMKRPEVQPENTQEFTQGYTHLAFSLGSQEAVDELTERLVMDGYPKLNGPRTTGDGYYESVLRDPDGNLLELTV